jgi:uncharacterized protein (DUF1684 family)
MSMNRRQMPSSLMYVFTTVTVVLLLWSFLCLPVCDAQFGVKPNKDQVAATHAADSEHVASEDGYQQRQQQNVQELLDFDMSKYQEVATKLQIKAPNLDAQDAIDIAVLLGAAVQDPETKLMVENLRSGGGAKRLEAFEDSTTQSEMVMALKQTLDELKALEYLFQDPVRAVIEMHREGIVDEKRIDYYTENPEELANDTRKGLYFSFVSLAVAAGFL